MKIEYRARSWGDSWREIDLAQALQPVAADADGVAERAMSEASEANKIMGKLLANLVDRNILSIRDAVEIADLKGHIRIDNEEI